MPPLPNSPGTLKIQIRWFAENDEGAMTIFHVAYTGGPPTSSQCASMAATIAASQASHFPSLLNVDNATGACTVTDLSSDMGGEGTAGSGTAGTRTGSELAPGTSMVISKKVARHYRGGHPRSYLPLGSAGDISGGVWDDSIVTATNTAWGAFLGDVVGAGVGCTITGEISVSYRSGGALRPTPVKDPILSSAAQHLVGSQRRRNRKQ